MRNVTTQLVPSRQTHWWWLAAGSGLLLGVAVAYTADLALGGVLVVVAVLTFARSQNRSEHLVGLFWIAFALYSIVFYGLIIRFGFYPFYAAFVVSIVVALRRDRLRIDPTVAWLYLGFMITVAWSFLTFSEPIDSAVIQRLITFLVGPMVYLQFRSARGLRPVTGAAIVTSLIVATFVIYTAVVTGFGYRGALDANPNSAARLVAFGAVIVIAILLSRSGGPGYLRQQLVLVSSLGVMLYGMMLLASRGMVVALAVAVTAVTLRAIAADWRRSGIIVLVVSLAGLALLLPGSQSIIHRFTSPDEHVASAGSRIPIWEVTLESLTSSNLAQLAFGHGFDSSKPVVERRFLGQTSVHNTYLQMFYEFGLIGALLHIALQAYLLWRGWRTPGLHGSIMVGLTLLLVVENLSGDVADTFHYWITMGYVAAIGLWGGAGREGREGDSA